MFEDAPLMEINSYGLIWKYFKKVILNLLGFLGISPTLYTISLPAVKSAQVYR